MGSLSDGCLGNGGQVVGVIHEMFVVDGEEHTGVSEMLVATGDGLADRKRLLMQGCEAIIALPGGVGTFDELWESVAEVALGFKDLPVALRSALPFSITARQCMNVPDALGEKRTRNLS